MDNPQKLHPITYFTGLIKVIKQNFILIIIFVFFQMKDFDFTNWKSYIVPGVVTLAFLVGFIRSAIITYRTRYWIEGDHFIVTSGIFNYERKELDIRRIQSIDTTQDVVHRIVGGVKLIVKTPSDGIDLETITRQQSELIRETLQTKQNQLLHTQTDASTDSVTSSAEVEKEEVPTEALFRLSTKNLILMSMTNEAIFVALLTIGPILGSMTELIPWEALFDTVGTVFRGAISTTIFTICVLLLISYIIGIVINFVRYFGFMLYRNGDLLTVRYGLLSVKNMTVPLSRVQSIIEKQSFIQRLFGYTSFQFVTTSDMKTNLEDDTTDGNVIVLPFIQKEEALKIFSDLVPDTAFYNAQKGLPWRGFHRRFWLWSIGLIIVGGVAEYYLNQYIAHWLWLPISVIIIYAIIHSLLAVTQSGMTITQQELTVRKVKLFSFETDYVKHSKIIGFYQMSHPFMQRSQLRHFHFEVASGQDYRKIGLKFAENEQVHRCFNWYIKGDVNDA